MSEGPAWLAAFQQEWSQQLTQLLDRSLGHLRSLHSQRGLAVYNEQYWFRLFTCLQQQYPLLSRLIGYWSFNLLCEEYLQEHPPKAYDLAHIGSDLVSFLESHPLPQLSEPNKVLWRQAARVDRAFEACFLAPAPTTADLQLAEVPHAHTQLTPQPHWQIIHQTWPLVERRLQLSDGTEDSFRTKLVPLQREVAYLLLRKNRSIQVHRLAPLQALLYWNLRTKALAQVLEDLLTHRPEESSALSAEHIQEWFARSKEWQLWQESFGEKP